MVEEACRRLQLDPGEQAVAAATRLRQDAMREWLQPWPDAAVSLERLHRAGYRFALMSDCTIEVPDLFDRLSFSCLFQVRLFSCLLGTRKPDPAMYALACEKLGVAPADCLYVGDGASQELSGAHRAGMDAVLIDVPGHGDNVVGREESRDWTGPRVSSLTELAEHLLEAPPE
jgi:putative hydrolase of the HAD superfamily